MMFTLPELPYALNALEPYVTGETLALHYGKHHKAYIDKTNDLIRHTGCQGGTLEQVIAQAIRADGNKALFNNAAQAWNHSFYWSSLTAGGGGPPNGEIAERVNSGFGSYETFIEQFTSAATGLFGSGWIWLVLDGDELAISQTSNADTPMAHWQVPLLTLDVWEHAYYLDHQNRRAEYVSAYLDHLIDWEFANENLRHAADFTSVLQLFEKPTIPHVVS